MEKSQFTCGVLGQWERHSDFLMQSNNLFIFINITENHDTEWESSFQTEQDSNIQSSICYTL